MKVAQGARHQFLAGVDARDALAHVQVQRRYTGGTVLHLYMGERISSIDACKKLVARALGKFHLPYLTVTPTFSICPEHGYLSGEHEFCPRCDDELISRMTAAQNTMESKHENTTRH